MKKKNLKKAKIGLLKTYETYKLRYGKELTFKQFLDILIKEIENSYYSYRFKRHNY